MLVARGGLVLGLELVARGGASARGWGYGQALW